ncbi:hypothetical protein ACP70R_049726 [Stipagrostis hirtigluma subsp. patula]
MAAVRAAVAVAARRLARRLLSSAAGASLPLLGHFHEPRPTTDLPDFMRPRRPSAPTFVPAAASSPRLSLDFLPVDVSVGFSLYDSHLGLLLLLQGAGGGLPRLLVCDPVSRRHALLPLPPASARGEFVGAALLSRAGGFEFVAACLTVDAGRVRAWVASLRDGECSWRALPPSGDVEITFDPFWFEQRCVHAAGSLYWHICNNDSALALDPATMEFSFLRAPALMLDDKPFTKYRIGEMPDDGRLCVGALEDQKLQLCVQGTGSLDGWVLERQVCLRKVLDMVPGLPKDHLSRNYCTWLSDVDGGHTGRVFIMTRGRGRFSYNVDTGKLDRLATDDGMEYGHPIFAYFGSPDTRSD